MPDVAALSLLLKSKIPIIAVETYDEMRALDVIAQVAVAHTLDIYCWTVTKGLIRYVQAGANPGTEVSTGRESPAITDLPQQANAVAASAEVVLARMAQIQPGALFVLCDFHPYLANKPESVRRLKEIALAYDSLRHTVMLIGGEVSMPPEIRRLAVGFSLSPPNDEQLLALVQEEGGIWMQESKGGKIKSDPGVLKNLVRNLRGLSFADARRLARQAIRNDGAITESDLAVVNRAKFELLGMKGVMSFELDTRSFADVGGLQKLKEWMRQREQVWSADMEGADRPRGVLLLGVQGGGKSLAARAIAGMWALPLLRLDMGALYNKYIGETERNLREALALAEAMSPCAVWIDEIEKGVASGDGDDGTSRRVLGTLLTWMAENKKMVFIVATANDVTRLPPELMRKGRLDEVFFVDLPSASVRADIFSIHLRKRKFDPANFDLKKLAELSPGFSGAEVEQAIISAVYRSSSRAEQLTSAAIEIELQSTRPLSVVRAEDIEALRSWAAERTVMAD